MAAFVVASAAAQGLMAPAKIAKAPVAPAAAAPQLTHAALSLHDAAPVVVGHASSKTSVAAGLALIAGGVAGASQRRRRSNRTVRNFFGSFAGDGAPKPVKQITSYKDFEDPWLGGCDLFFDPLSLAIQDSSFDQTDTAVRETTYYNYRESEVKHGRFAMVAFLAIFAEEADRNALLSQMGVSSAIDTLDGTLGLDELQAPVLLVGLGYQALAEYNLQQGETDDNFFSVEYKKDRCPGDLGFDPAGILGVLGGDKKSLHNLEVNIGRLGMIGITSFLFKEFLIKDENVVQTLLSDSKL